MVNQVDMLTINQEILACHSGQTDMRLSAVLEGEIVGRLDYSEYQGIPSIQIIFVLQEYRRMGIGSTLLLELQSLYPGIQIELGMLTEEGKLLVDSLEHIVEPTEYQPLFQEYRELVRKDLALQEASDSFFNGNSTESFDSFLEKTSSWNDIRDRMYEIENLINGKNEFKTTYAHRAACVATVPSELK